jgi:hypothetical protein
LFTISLIEDRPPAGCLDISNWEFIQGSKSLKIKNAPLEEYFTFSTKSIRETARVASAEARQTMEACTRNRRLFITANGRLGLAPVRVQKGDRVVILSSHKVPLIVRPVEEIGGGYLKGGLRARIIGEAYVSGIMYGEIVDEFEEISRFTAGARLIPCFFV